MNQQNEIPDLPKEMWTYILSFLQPKDLLSITTVSKTLNICSSDNMICKKFVRTKNSIDQRMYYFKHFFLTDNLKKINITVNAILGILFRSQITDENKFRSGDLSFILSVSWTEFTNYFRRKNIQAIHVTNEIIEKINSNKTAYPNGINQVGFQGNTIAHFLATIGEEDTIELLIKQKADMNKKNQDGECPNDLIDRYNLNFKQSTPSL